jgi:hypothetical protein
MSGIAQTAQEEKWQDLSAVLPQLLVQLAWDIRTGFHWFLPVTRWTNSVIQLFVLLLYLLT